MARLSGTVQETTMLGTGNHGCQEKKPPSIGSKCGRGTRGEASGSPTCHAGRVKRSLFTEVSGVLTVYAR